MSYTINAVNNKNNNKPAVIKALRAKEISYKDLPPAVTIRVGWDYPGEQGTHWETAEWRCIPTNRVAWAGRLMDGCPQGCTPVILLSSLENAGVTLKEVLELARYRGFQSVRLVDN